MYNLRLFMHNKLVLIELGMWWHTVIPICTTEELEPNRLYHSDALNPQHAGIQFVCFEQCEQGIPMPVEIMYFTLTLFQHLM